MRTARANALGTKFLASLGEGRYMSEDDGKTLCLGPRGKVGRRLDAKPKKPIGSLVHEFSIGGRNVVAIGATAAGKVPRPIVIDSITGSMRP